MYRKILVPLDGSARAEAILPHVENMATRYEAGVILLRVDEESLMMLGRDEVIDVNEHLEKRRQRRNKIEVYLQAIIDKWRTRGVEAQMHIGQGQVVACIIETAIREQVGLVAMSSHGRSGMERAFYGSVAVGVLNKIDRPLLLVRSRRLR